MKARLLKKAGWVCLGLDEDMEEIWTSDAMHAYRPARKPKTYVGLSDAFDAYDARFLVQHYA